MFKRTDFIQSTLQSDPLRSTGTARAASLARRAIAPSMAVLCLALSGCATMGLDGISPSKTKISADIANAPVSRQSGTPAWVEQSATLAQGRLPSTDWVSSFSDPTLSALITEALAANTNIRASRARLAAAEASAKSARAGLYPSISASTSATRSDGISGLVPAASSFSLGSSVSWEADLWGRVNNQAKAGDLEAQASNADFAATRLAIAGAISQTWFDVIEARLQRDLSNRNVTTQERALRLTKRRFDGGVSGSSDYRLARSAFASAKASLASREQILSATTRQLETLLRRYPADALKADRQLPNLPPLTNAGSPRDIFLRRPDLLAAERRMLASGLRVDIAKKNLLPRLTLSGGSSTSGGSLGRLFSLDALIGSITGGLSAPLFQGGALKAEVKRNEANLQVQMENYADTTLTAYREVENALDAEGHLSTREQALTVSAEEARKAEERLEQRFSEGLASILQLLDAQSRRINAEGQLISARKERLANRVRLHLALGGGQYGQELPRQKLSKPSVKFPKIAQVITGTSK